MEDGVTPQRLVPPLNLLPTIEPGTLPVVRIYSLSTRVH